MAPGPTQLNGFSASRLHLNIHGSGMHYMNTLRYTPLVNAIIAQNNLKGTESFVTSTCLKNRHDDLRVCLVRLMIR